MIGGVTCARLKAEKTIRNATIVAHYQPAQPHVLKKRIPASGITIGSNHGKLFTFQVPKEKSRLTFRLTAGTGDAGLYVKRGSAPSLASHDAFAAPSSYSEFGFGIANTPKKKRITLHFPDPGTYYLLVHAFTDVKEATIVASYR